MESIGSKEEGQEEPTAVPEWSEMALPGFRFHPTEEELVGYYLRRMVQGRRNSVELIASLDLYQYDPWELPALAFMGEKEWFFFCPRDKKYPNGARPNRVTASGYWKATGTDRPVRCSGDSRCIGLKKTLVFYTGRAPRGNKTEWIMNEYRMPKPAERSISVMTSGVNSISYSFSTYDNFVIKNDVALCRIYRKSSSALNSANFISAIGARDLEERTNRMMSRFESNPAAGTHQQQNHIQRLQGPDVPNVNVRVSSDMPMAPLSAAAPSSDNDCAQQLSTSKTTTVVSHGQAVEAAKTQRQQQLIDGPAQGGFDGVSPMIDCTGTTTSEEASRQLQIALRTAMAKLDGAGSSSNVNFNDGDSLNSNGSGIFGRFRNRLVQDAAAAAACPSTSVHVMRSPSPEAAAAATATFNNSHTSRVPPTKAPDHLNQPMNSPRDIPTVARSNRSSSAETVAAFAPAKSHPTCRTPRVSIPPSFNHHVNSCPSTKSTTTTSHSLEEGSNADANTVVSGPTAINNRSNISASSISQLEDQVQSLVNACSIPPLSNTYSLKRSRFTKVQHADGESCPMAKMPSAAQYWRQSSYAPSQTATAAAQLSTFDALSGLTFQY
ncbi:protein MpNAC8 [Marchantia polymorpha subsp. ruderalis]|uniref:NAC domain-containing protein n=2 Tax=Marchantia polymorpha TaxID=3197 RepID=A0AAF6BMV0_MARPO|nr:hypothetical protein MARPO_0035s0054 [Marchantia polymorpha]BBN13334.1 hypothetical protein Mp_6g02670 [Marchantia polymorpha subsp. ruderalis]|eukprot:PTQ41262.1 hypothetical protein MARPO_0035s0054 [Marchantia polymorpha]